MRAALAILLVALLFVCAQSRIAYSPYGKYSSRIYAADEEEADAEFLGKFLKKVGKVALDAGKMYVGNKYGIQLDAEDEEEADAEFLGKALKKVGKVALSVGKMYARTQGIPIDEAEEESDAEFLGKALKKVGKVALSVGKQYVSSKYGINLDEEEEEADAEFLKSVLKKVGKVALQAGKAYVGSKYGIQLDEEEEADFINWKKVWGTAKDIGKNYLSTKYGINLDEEEETDAEFLSKLKNWWNSKGKDLAIKGLQIYSQIKNGGAQQGDEAEEESDSEASDCGESYTQGRATGRKQCVTIDGNPVVTSTAEVYNRMKAAAAAAGVHLKLNSGFRTNAEQTRLYNCYLTKKCNNGNLAAKPGFSNHQNGIALDISVTNPATYNWLVNNASKFGFVRTVASEKWHWELRNSRCNAFVSYSCK